MAKFATKFTKNNFSKQRNNKYSRKSKVITRLLHTNGIFVEWWTFSIFFLIAGLGAPVNNPCYEMYAGSRSFSEKESIALANYLNATKKDIIAYVSLHTYGQKWMTPYGFTKTRPQSYKELVGVFVQRLPEIFYFWKNFWNFCPWCFLIKITAVLF